MPDARRGRTHRIGNNAGLFRMNRDSVPTLPRISAVIPTHNSCRWIDACLGSLLGQRGVSVTAAVVDNASQDGTAEHVRRNWPNVKVIELRRNVGYGAAVNIGAKALPQGDLLALNVDTELQQDALRALADVLAQDSEAGAAAPWIVEPSGRSQTPAHRFPTIPRLLAEAIGLDSLPIVGSRAGYHLADSGPGRQRIDWASGVALLVRERAWHRVGGFDPAYFFFVEEVDLQRRLFDAGWRVTMEPAAVIVHHGGKRPLPVARFLSSHDGFERYFGLRGGRRAAVLARLMLCLTALTRAAGWSALALTRPRGHTLARRWARMFLAVAVRSAMRLPRVPRRFEPYEPCTDELGRRHPPRTVRA